MRPRYGMAALALVTAGCGASSGYGGQAARTTGASPSRAAGAGTVDGQLVNDGGTLDATGRTTVDVSASDFAFSPSTILARPGQVLTLVVHNGSKTPHNISATSEHVSRDLAPGSTQRVTLTVPASGRLVFFCSFHAASGMAGSLGPAGAAGASAGPTGGSSGAATPGGYAPYGTG
ncbi:MAG: cupredoxin domain-containing protein [Mycobacteriales bacterium]